ncbi:Trihelix transcription factor PTL [Bienertia sinuspersici]
MEMEDQYGISDLRQFISRAAVGSHHQFPPYPQPHMPSSSDIFTPLQNHRGGLPSSPHQQQPPYHMVVMGRSMSTAADMLHHNSSGNNNNNNNGFLLQHNLNNNNNNHQFNSDSTTTTATAAATTTNSGGFDVGDVGAARWPRQETLTLLEIRSRLDHKFKDANQKGPLWDEVARIMSEEHGYQRTGKKCREKFENLYKYYKKTKEGKAGRQDGKHYRFFRQLEALYGEHHNSHHHHHHPITSTSETHHISGNTPHFYSHNISTNNIITPTKLPASDNNNIPHSLLRHNNASVSLSNTSDYDSSSSDNEVGADSGEESGEESNKKKKMKKKGKRSWKAKIKEFIDHQMRKIMEKQEAWLDKMMRTLENRERERIEREEEWRKQEVERVEKEHKFWASERAWIEARDSALMTALEKLTNTREKEVIGVGNLNNADNHHHHNHGRDQWLENEVTRLIQLRTSMESRFQQCGFSEEVLWEDIAAKMAYLGYDRSATVCKEKWDCINKFFQEKGINTTTTNNNNNNIIIKDNEGNNKKRKENYGEVSNNHHHYHSNHNEGVLYMNRQMGGFISNSNNNCEINEPRLQLNEGSSSSPSSHNSNANVNVNANASVAGGSVMNDSCLRFFLSDGNEGLGWESSYVMKLNNKGGGNDDQCA